MAASSSLVPGLEGDTIMAQMQKLFEPPGKNVPQKQDECTAELHPYFKRPGKGHNHDCCDSCFEGGALICCDSCPSSFHLQVLLLSHMRFVETKKLGVLQQILSEYQIIHKEIGD